MTSPNLLVARNSVVGEMTGLRSVSGSSFSGAAALPPQLPTAAVNQMQRNVSALDRENRAQSNTGRAYTGYEKEFLEFVTTVTTMIRQGC